MNSAQRPTLTDETEILRRKVEVLFDAVVFYANMENWKTCKLPGSELGNTVIDRSDWKQWNDGIYDKRIGGEKARNAIKYIQRLNAPLSGGGSEAGGK